MVQFNNWSPGPARFLADIMATLVSVDNSCYGAKHQPCSILLCYAVLLFQNLTTPSATPTICPLLHCSPRALFLTKLWNFYSTKLIPFWLVNHQYKVWVFVSFLWNQLYVFMQFDSWNYPWDANFYINTPFISGSIFRLSRSDGRQYVRCRLEWVSDSSTYHNRNTPGDKAYDWITWRH